MGTTKMQHRRRRRARARGTASLIAFWLLFAFAVGQGGSIIAFAFDQAGSGPTVSKDGSAPTSDDSGDGGSTAGSGTAKVSGSGPAAVSSDDASTATRRVRADRDSDAQQILAVDPGDIELDFVAAAPQTYNHETGLGGEFGDRDINEQVVESLEGGDFECGDLVVFFVEVVVNGTGDAGTLELDMAFGAETTGQPGVGFTDIVSASINTGDDGNVGLDGDETATLGPVTDDTVGYDETLATISVAGLEGGETAIVRIVAELGCAVGASPTGNILSEIDAARLDGTTVNVGQETVPLKKVEDIAQPGLNVNKTCPATATVGSEITYTIQIVNTGNEALDILSVVDTVNGHAGVNITSSFPDTVAAGATVSATFKYTVLASDPDPLPNSVAVTAEGVISEASVTGNASCVTDIVHVPGIDVTKSCPAAVAEGEDISYTITVRNTGNEPLTGVTVNDTLLGNITGDFNFDFSQPFPAGSVATATVTYEQQAGDPDPLTNTVTASGTGADSKTTVTDTASCTTDITHVPGIAVMKSCPAAAGEGDVVIYTITVSNTGNEALEDVTVMDTILGDLSDSFADTLDEGDSETQEFDFTVPEGADDPLVNVVTASGTGADSGTTVNSAATCSTDILHPGIDIDKTVSDDTVTPGTTVTYTFVVTNTGDTTLFDIVVTDDVMGEIGTIDQLEPGNSATLTADFVVGEVGVTNVAVARGHDILGRVVEASDDANVAVVLVETPPPTTPPTPFTGSDAGRLGLLAALVFGIGLTVVAATRRWRSGDVS